MNCTTIALPIEMKNTRRRWPPAVVRIVKAARRRYWQTPPLCRPTLNDPVAYCGLFTFVELTKLACAGAWPLPGRLIKAIRREAA